MTTLVTRAKAGDAQAFGQIVDQLHLRVFRFLLRMVGSASDAEDLTQDVFLEAYRKLDRFRGESKFSTWALGIAFNMGRTFVRRAPERRYSMTDVDALYDMASDNPDPEQQAHSSTRMQILSEAMKDLPDDLMTALSMVAVDGMSYDEAALIADIPLGTMKTRVFRARKLVRDFVGDRGALDLFGLDDQ